MTIKEIKNYRRDIEILKREDPDKMKKKIKELLDRILAENGQESYENELEITFDNLLYYYVHKGERMPEQCYDLAIEFAEMLIEKENLQRAEEVVLSAANITTKREETKNEVTQTDNPEFIKLRNEILKIYELKNKKKNNRDIESYNIFMQMAKKHDIEAIKCYILGQKEEREKVYPPNPPGETKKRELADYLYPEYRLDFIQKSFPNRKLKFYQGMSKFEEYIIIEIEGMESVIAEKFFDQRKDGKVKVTKGTDATFIVPKEFVLDLQYLSKPELMEFSVEFPRIKKCIHRKGYAGIPYNDEGEIQYDNISYYTRFKTKFNISVGYEFFEGFGMEEKQTIKKPKNVKPERKKIDTKNKKKIDELKDTKIVPEEPVQPCEQDEKIPTTQPKSKREELKEILAMKFQMVQQLTEELKVASVNNKEITEICENLRQAVEELEKIQKQIRELGED